MLGRYLAKERDRFRKLTINARDLIKSFVLFEITGVVIVIFTSAFIWSSVRSEALLATYYLTSLCPSFQYSFTSMACY